jgi:L-lactate dehydrogenase complex protein LldF
MGISGANFLVAETGTLVIVTNEGNGRMCTTMPELQVAVVGIDKVIPDWESLTVFLKLLARSATRQKLSTYTQFITGPRRVDGEFGPKEFHLVLLDNGRSDVLKDPVGRQVWFPRVAPAAFAIPCAPAVRCSEPGAGSFHIPPG